MTLDESTTGRRLAASIYGRDEVDFIAIDSRRRAPGSYDARGHLFQGNGYYHIQFTQRDEALDLTTPPTVHTVPTYDIVHVKDVWLGQGQCLVVRASNFQHNKGGMYVMPDAYGSTNGVSSREAALAQVQYSPADTGAKSLTFTAPRSGWYGFVVANSRSDHRSPLTPDTLLRYQRVAC